MSNSSTEERNDDYEPSQPANAAAAPIANSIFESNGNPQTMTLDVEQLTRILAFALDAAISAAGRTWK